MKKSRGALARSVPSSTRIGKRQRPLPEALGLRLTVVLGALSLLGAAGCESSAASDSDAGVEPPDDASGPIEEGDLLAKLLRAICSNMGPCCRQEGYPYDDGQCRAGGLRDELEATIARLRSRSTTYDPVAARVCVNAFADLARTCATPRRFESLCRPVFPGGVSIGGACESSNDCVLDSICSAFYNGSAECIPRPEAHRGKLGDPCFASCAARENGEDPYCGLGPSPHPSTTDNAACFRADNLYCNQIRNGVPQTAATCTALSLPSEICESLDACADGLFCKYTLCSPPMNQFCVSERECVASAYCDSSVQACRPRLARGQSCQSSAACQASDVCDSVCRANRMASSIVCRSP